MTTSMPLLPGFNEPAQKSQTTFKALLEALARPGRLFTLPAPETVVPGLSPASAAIALTIIDFETPVWLDKSSQLAAEYIQFHCGCHIVDDPKQATFAFAISFDALPPLEHFKLGTDEEPEDSTTLVVGVASLANESSLALTGPGIENEHCLKAAGLTDPRIRERAALSPLFPRGLDFFLTCEHQVVGISRTTQIKTIRN